MLFITHEQFSPHARCQHCQRFGQVVLCVQKKVDEAEEALVHFSCSADIVALCQPCWRASFDELEAVAIQYRHPTIPLASLGIVSPKIRQIFPHHAWSGRIVKTCEGYYYPGGTGSGPSRELVPVRLRSWPANRPPFRVPRDYLLLFEQDEPSGADSTLLSIALSAAA